MDKLIHELHTAFDFINEAHYNNELIPPIITVQANPNKKKIIYGWCSCLPRWIRKINEIDQHFYEINITSNRLDSPYEEVIETLIHEVVHLANNQHNIEDCNSHSQKHNEHFKTEAERIGLIVEKAGRTGYSQTSLSDNLLAEIQEMGLDEEAFNIKRIEEFKDAKLKPRKPTFKYKCPKCSKELKSIEEKLIVKCMDCDCEYIKISK
ncbi:SprT-like domain-containing protein [Clostridium tagluense]|uniref:SprT-like domain-containing protein n=1 Tax=Clostridium tagluense TaxID=360422 RepID=A0A401UQ63_9CLOT|nr:SprT-like domain-containing protein [Clostridium tagluense]GCD11692.1 hypothetical protein Ctaglu_33150 [Clostridium tagluense]